MAYVAGWSLEATTWLLLDKARLSGGTDLPIDLLQQPKVNVEDVESTNEIFSGIESRVLGISNSILKKSRNTSSLVT